MSLSKTDYQCMEGSNIVHNLEEDSKVVGTKQTLRAIESGHAKVVFIAEDASAPLKEKLVACATAENVDIVYYDSMKKLGDACSVAVKTAVAAIVS